MTDILRDILPADFHLLREETRQYPAADSMEALEAFSAAAVRENAPGMLAPVGLVVVPAAYDDGVLPGIREADLPALLPRLRAAPGVSIRGCLAAPALAGADAAAVAACFHEIYQVAKRMTVLLPCAMPWLGFCGMLAPIRACVGADPAAAALIHTAAATVAMQNSTAFYARLLIS